MAIGKMLKKAGKEYDMYRRKGADQKLGVDEKKKQWYNIFRPVASASGVRLCGSVGRAAHS